MFLKVHLVAGAGLERASDLSVYKLMNRYFQSHYLNITFHFNYKHIDPFLLKCYTKLID